MGMVAAATTERMSTWRLLLTAGWGFTANTLLLTEKGDATYSTLDIWMKMRPVSFGHDVRY